MRRWWFALAVVLGSCHKPPPVAEVAATAAKPAEVPVSFDPEPEADGLVVRLYEAETPGGAATVGTTSAAAALDPAATKALLARLPALEPDPTDTTDFALREGPRPPPRTGASVQVEFPGRPAEAPTATPGALALSRRAPEGEVPLAPHLSVSFTEPMVALTTQDAAAQVVPVKLAPQPAGQWRWLGTKTLVFEPQGRFPMATAYTVEVPAGTRSVNGAALAEPQRWSFGTPGPTLVASGPGAPGADPGSQPLQPTLWFAFDQRVDPAAVLPFISLTASGSGKPLRLATAEELAAVPALAGGSWAADRVVALVPVSPLPGDTSLSVTLAAGLPSAEGPRTLPASVSWRFRTYGPLRHVKTECGWEGRCLPGESVRLDFTNGLAADLDPSSITLSPPVPGLQIQPSGTSLYLSGDTQGRTTYTISVAPTLKDIYGQTLGRTVTTSFTVGPAERSLSGPPGMMVVSDPVDTQPSLSVWTVNEKALQVTAYAVAPQDWLRFAEWMDRDVESQPPPGRAFPTRTVTVASKPDARVETKIDLAGWLPKGTGHLIVRVQQVSPPRDRWRRQEWLGWVQVTRIGLTAFVDPTRVLGWANELATGAPLRDATLQLLPGGATTATGVDGLGTLELPADSVKLLVARQGEDTAFVPSSEYPSRWSGWQRYTPTAGLTWYLASDRQLYRPGETVRIKGWVRSARGSRVTLPQPAVGKVAWTVSSSIGNRLADGTAEVDANGGVALEFALPKTPDLGRATVVLQPVGAWDGAAGVTAVDVQEFRRPEFEVTAEVGEGPWTLGEDATVSARAAYYAGGPLPGADVRWAVRAEPASFVPPGREDWSFGVWRPWWRSWERPSETQLGELASTTDATGRHHLGVHFESLKPARPMEVRVEATVQDVNRQALAGSTRLLLHPSSLYVGLKVDRLFVESGKPVEVRALVVDRAGVPAPTVPADLAVVRSVGTWKNGGWTTLEEPVASCALLASRDDAPCRWAPPSGGEYVVRATVRDAAGRPNVSEVRVWATGGADLVPDRGVSAEEVTLVPEKAELAPGETFRLFVQAPFAPAEGVLTVRVGELVHSERITLTGPSTTVSMVVPEAWIPEVAVAVDLVGRQQRAGDDGKLRADLPPRVAWAQGALTLKVPPAPRTLAVRVTPGEPKLDPGGSTTLAVEVLDAAGRPVPGADLAVVAVDESVLALTGYRLPDPLSVFYAALGDPVATEHLRRWVRLTAPGGLAAHGSLGTVGTGSGGGGIVAEGAVMMDAMVTSAPAPGAPVARNAAVPTESRRERSTLYKSVADEEAPDRAPDPSAGPVVLRTNFDPLALWAPSVPTDAAGRATVDVKLPDSLTRYRIMVIATAGADRFGSGQADLTARLPLMVRPSPPRFLNYGDRAQLPVVVQNQTDTALTVDVGLRATNLEIDGADGAARRVVVAANDRVEVRFPARALSAGTARWQAVAVAGTRSDAASGSLPVWTPATTEAFATYGTVTDQLVVQPVATPTGVVKDFGGLEVSTSSTQLQALTDAVLYLAEYPYGCNEQISSRVLGVASLRDVLQAFSAEGLPPAATLEASVSADLEVLAKRQNTDGGWGFWRRDERSWPYLSLHVAHALVRAKEKGFAVEPRALERALAYATRIESHLPRWYSEASKRSLRAYAVYVRELAGQDPSAQAAALAAGELPLEAQGWILPTLHRARNPKAATLLAGWGNLVTESAGTAHFVTSYSDGAEVLLHSDRRVDGILLDALLRVRPQDELIPKIVAGLLAHKTAGRWANTNESAFVLLALDRYFRVYEGVTPEFVARAWLGERYAGDHRFSGRTTERAELRVPMAELSGTKDLVLQRDGAGRLYYRIGLRYAPSDLVVPAADRGFTVVRRYRAVDDPAEVRRDEDGVWRVRAGARVEVTVEMVTPMRRAHVALVDPLPAGFELLNPALKGTGELPPDPTKIDGPWWWWSRPWYDHENLRDERVEAFASLLWDGVWSYRYYARATTPGSFVVPPAKAEEMYAPETFGRSAGDRVIVE